MRKDKELEKDDCKKFTFVHDNFTKKQKAFADKFWSCFALQKNYKFIMSTDLGKDSLNPIHGIRTLGMLLIIIGKKKTFLSNYCT